MQIQHLHLQLYTVWSTYNHHRILTHTFAGGQSHLQFGGDEENQGNASVSGQFSKLANLPQKDFFFFQIYTIRDMN